MKVAQKLARSPHFHGYLGAARVRRGKFFFNGAAIKREKRTPLVGRRTARRRVLNLLVESELEDKKAIEVPGPRLRLPNAT